MTEPPDAPPAGVPIKPEGLLIKKALAAAGLSQRAAAKRARISETWWRQLVSGYTTVHGQQHPNHSPAATLARMARVVNVTPEQLEDVGRPDAAAALRETIEAERSRSERLDSESASGPAGAQSRLDERWHMLEAVLRQAEVGLSPSEYDTLVTRVNVFFAQSPDRQPPDEVPAAEDPRPGRTRRGTS
jgi:hypothetical protein